MSRGGLSPRGRGKLARRKKGRRRLRSIPAWAGQTSLQNIPDAVRTVYPRVGGANLPASTTLRYKEGLSPRGRGKLPAQVGRVRRRRVYPRLAGETRRGAPSRSELSSLSPRGRGKRPANQQPEPRPRSIPAWAGQTMPDQGIQDVAPVYPRVGGANPLIVDNFLALPGLSPRGRGKLLSISSPYQRFRSIPAWAGQTRSQSRLYTDQKVYPRVGGANSISSEPRLLTVFPRGRGTRVPSTKVHHFRGLSPVGGQTAGMNPACARASRWGGQT